MEKMKSFVTSTFTVLMFCFLFANVLTVHAETAPVNGKVYINYGYDVKGNVKEQKKMRISTYADSVSSFDVRYGSGDKISGLKVNKKGLEAQVISSENRSNYGTAYIGVYATKPGTYKVSFDVVNSANQKRGRYTVQVQAVNSSAVIKKAAFGKQTVISNTASIKKGVKKSSSKESCKVKGASGKFKVTANSQYKITGILVVSVDKNGKYTYKKFKNGKKLTLSKNYEVTSTNAYNGTKSHSAKKKTYIYISYKDKFYGDSVTYSISGARGSKEVKCVTRDAFTGRRTTSYSRCPSATITLWQY